MDGTATARPRHPNLWILAGLSVCFAVIFVQYTLKVRDSDRAASQSAFQRWVPLVRTIDTANIWHTHLWPNPPIMALILRPFMEVESPLLGAQLWMLAKMICGAVSVLLILNMLDQPEHPFPLWGKALAVAFTIRPFEGDLVHGNVNLFILLTVVLGLHAFSRGRDISAGLWISLGIACKVTPALFLPYFLWKRAWKALAASAFGLVLFLFLLPSLYFGWARNWDNLHAWVQGMIVPFVVQNEVTSEQQNQSLPGLLERMLRERPSVTKRGPLNYIPDAYHHFADLPREFVSWLVKASMGLFCIAVIWRCRASRERPTDWRWMAEFGAVVLGMLIFSERTWKHHAVTLLIPFAVLAHQLSAFRLPPARRVYLIGTAGAVAILMLLTTTGLWKGQDEIGRLAQIYGAYLWSFVLLVLAMFTLAGQKANDPPRGMPASKSPSTSAPILTQAA